MSTLEREVIDKFRQLDRDAQRRVREMIDREIDFDFDAWWARVEAVRIKAHGQSASDLVNEVREERDADILSQ